MGTPTLNGADLQSKVATNGTVRLIVNHADEHYELRTQHDYLETDYIEIVDYLTAYGFVVLDEYESPREQIPTGWRYWAAHVRGEQFGFAGVGVVGTVTAIGLSIAAALPRVFDLMDLVAA